VLELRSHRARLRSRNLRAGAGGEPLALLLYSVAAHKVGADHLHAGPLMVRAEELDQRKAAAMKQQHLVPSCRWEETIDGIMIYRVEDEHGTTVGYRIGEKGRGDWLALAGCRVHAKQLAAKKRHKKR